MAVARAIIDVDINTSPAATALRKLQAQVNAFQTALNRGNVVQGAAAKEYARSLSDLVNSTQYFTAETVRMRTSAAQLDDTLRKGQGSISQYFNSLKRGTAEYAAVTSLAQQRAAALQTQFVATGAAAGGYRDALAIRPIQAFSDATSVANERIAVQRALFNQATTSMINFGKNTQWAGRQLMVGFTVPLTIFGTLAGKTFMDLEKSAISFKKVYGDAFTTPEELDANLKAVRQLSNEFTKYGIAASDTMEMAAQAAAAGAKNADLIDATTEATRLATLGQMEQTKALEATISLQNAFGLSSEKLTKSINFMNMVENQTVLTLQDMADAIPRVAPVIKGLGGSVEDMAAMLAAMKEGGVSAAQGANALKSGLASLINPTNRAIESLGKMGINLNNIIQTNKGDLMGTVQSFAVELGKLDKLAQQQVLENVFGKYQYARLGALFKNIIKDGTQASRVLEMAGMSAQQMAATAEKELGTIAESPATKLTAAIERMKLALAPIGEIFVRVATPVIEIFTRLLDIFNGLPEGIKKIGAIGTIIVGVLIPAGTMFLGLLMNLVGTLLKFGNIFRVAFQGFTKGGLKGAISAISQSLRYMSIQEIETAQAAQQLGKAADSVSSTLLEQVGAAGGATGAIDSLAGAYARLALRMEEAAAVSSAFATPGAAMARAGRSGQPPVRVVRRNTGGTIPGAGNKDTVPAMLTPGEFVVNKDATAQNLPLLHAINSGQAQGFNMGGGVAKKGRTFYGRFQSKLGIDPRLLAIGEELDIAHQRQLQEAAALGLFVPGQRQQSTTSGMTLHNAHFGAPKLGTSQAEQLARMRTGNNRVALGVELVRAGVPVTALTDDWATVSRRLNIGANRSENEKMSIAQAINELEFLNAKDIIRLGPAMQREMITPDEFYTGLLRQLSLYDPNTQFTDAIFTNARNAALADLGKKVRPKITGLRIPTQVDLREFVGGLQGVDPQTAARLVQDADIARELSTRGFDYITAAERPLIMSGRTGLREETGRSSGYHFAEGIPMFGGGGAVGMFRGMSTILGGLRKAGVKQRSSRVFWEKSPFVLPYPRMERQDPSSSRGRIWAEGVIPEETKRRGMSRKSKGTVIGHIYSRQFYERFGSSQGGASPRMSGQQIHQSIDYQGMPLKSNNTYDLLPNQYILLDENWNRGLKDGILKSKWKNIDEYDMVSLLSMLMSNGVPEQDALAIAKTAARKINARISSYNGPINERKFGELVTGSTISALKSSKGILRLHGMNKGGMIKGFARGGIAGIKEYMAGSRVDPIMAQIQRRRAQVAVADKKGIQDVLFKRNKEGKLDADPFDILTLIRHNPNLTNKQLQEIQKYHGRRIKDGIFGRFDKTLGYKIQDQQRGTWSSIEKELADRGFPILSRKGAGGIAGIASALKAWSTSSKHVRQTPSLLDPIEKLLAISKLPKQTRVGRRTAVGLAKGSEFDPEVADFLLKASPEELAKITSLSMRGPLSTTTGTYAGIDPDISRIMFLRQQHAIGRKRYLDDLKVIKSLEQKIASGRGPVGLYQRQLAERKARVAGYRANAHAIGREIKALAPRGYRILDLSMDLPAGTSAFTSRGSYMGKRLDESEIVIGSGTYPISSIQARNTGGQIFDSTQTSRRVVPGTGNRDTVPAMLTPGEFVINKQATAQNKDLLHAINSGMNIGGMVQAYELGGIVDAGNGQYLVEGRNGRTFGPMSEQDAMRRSRQLVSERARRFTRPSREGQMSRGMGMGVGMGLGALGGAMMMAPMIPAIGGNETLSNMAGMGGMGISMASMIPMFGKAAGPIAILAAAAAAAGGALYLMRKNVDDTAKEAAKLGSNIGGAANRMEEMTAATGYQFASQRQGDKLFRFTEQEARAASEYSSYFESERGQAFVKEISDLTSEDRYKKVASTIAMAIADGMKPKQAKAYGDAIAYYANDAMLKTRLATDFKKGKFEKGTQALVDLLKQRQDAINKELAGRTMERVPVTGGTRDIANATGIGIRDTATQMWGEASATVGLFAAGGAAIGSIIPGIGTAIGAVVGTVAGGITAFARYQDQVRILNENVTTAAMTFGSSIQVLKEAKNAEAALIEARANGTITAKQYRDQIAQVREVEKQSADSMKSIIDTMLIGGQVDEGAMKQALKDQLVLSGFEGDMAEAVTNTVNFNEVAKALFPTIDPEQVAQDADMREVVSSVMVETFAGITPENAAAKLADVRSQWAQIAQQLFQAAKDGMSLDPSDVRGILSSTAAGQALEQALASEGQVSSSQMSSAEKNAARDRALKTKPTSATYQTGGGTNNVYTDPQTGMQFSMSGGRQRTEGERRAARREDASKRLRETYAQTYGDNQTGAGQISISDLIDTDFTSDDAARIKDFAEQSGQEVDSVLEQLMEESPKFKSSLENMSQEAANALFGKGSKLDEVKGRIDKIFAGSEQKVLGKDVEYLGTQIDRSRDAWEGFLKNNEDVGAMGATVEQLSNAMISLGDSKMMSDITSSTDKMRDFSKLVVALADPKYAAIEISVATKYMFDKGLTPDNFVKKIDAAVNKINKLDFKKFGKNAKELERMAPDPMAFTNFAMSIGKSLKDIPKFYEETIKGVDIISDKFKKDITKSGKVKISTDLVMAIGGKKVDANANAIFSALNKIFPKGMSPILLPIILQIPNIGQVLSNISAGYGTGKGGKKARVPEGAEEAYNRGEATFTVDTLYGPQTLSTADYASQIQYNQSLDFANSFSGISLPEGGEKKGGGGAGQKSLFQQLMEGARAAMKMYRAVQDLMYNETKKGGVRFDKDFKKFIAGPFAPEFLEYLRSQGEEGLKIIKGGAAKVKKAYEAYTTEKLASLATQALYLPQTMRRERKNKELDLGMRRRLADEGRSGQQIEYIVERTRELRMAWQEAQNTLKQKLAIPKDKRTEQDKEAIKTAKEFMRVYRLRRQMIEDTAADDMELARQEAVQQSLQGLNDETKKSQTYLTYISQGILPDFASQLADMGEGELLTEEQKNKALQKIREIWAATQDPLQLKLDIINLEEQKAQIEAEMEILSRVNTEFAGKMADAGVQSAEELLALLEDQSDQIARSIELKQRDIEAIDDQISLLEEQKTKINEAFDERLKALDEVEKANERIYALQQGQLNVAQSLSRGDVAGAAQAAMELQQNLAQQRNQETRDALEMARQKQLKAVDSSINELKKQRKTIENEIKLLQLEQRAIQDQIYTVENRIKKITMEVNDKYNIGTQNLAKMKLEWQQIVNAIDEANKKLKTYNDATGGKVTTDGGGAGTDSGSSGGSSGNGGTGGAIYYNQVEWKDGLLYMKGTATLANGWVYDTNNNRKRLANYGQWAGDWTPMMYGGIVAYKGSREQAPGFMMGGRIKKFAAGSWVPGAGMTDKVPAMLTPGEFVVRKPVAQALGPALEALNGNVFPKMNLSGPGVGVKDGSGSSPVQYNYDINVNVAGSNASPDEIALAVMNKIKMTEDRSIRSYRY